MIESPHIFTYLYIFFPCHTSLQRVPGISEMYKCIKGVVQAVARLPTQRELRFFRTPRYPQLQIRLLKSGEIASLACFWFPGIRSYWQLCIICWRPRPTLRSWANPKEPCKAQARRSEGKPPMWFCWKCLRRAILPSGSPETLRIPARLQLWFWELTDSPRVIRTMLKSGVTGYVLKGSSASELNHALRSAACGRKFLDSRLVDAITLSRSDPPVETRREEGLSPRQLQVFRGLVKGYTNLELSWELHISVKTVETYRARIYEKLQLHNRADLMRYAFRVGAISLAS